MIKDKTIRDSFFWVFFIFYMYESYFVLFGDRTIPEAVNNLVVEFAPAVLIYVYAVFQKHFIDDTKEA